MNNVYLINEVGGDEKIVCGAFTTEPLANKAKNLIGDEEYEIEKVVLDAFPDIPEGMFAWRVWVSPDANLSRACKVNAYCAKPGIFEGSHIAFEYMKDKYSTSVIRYSSCFGINVFAESAEKAAEIAVRCCKSILEAGFTTESLKNKNEHGLINAANLEYLNGSQEGADRHE